MKKALNMVKRYYPNVKKLVEGKTDVWVSVTKADCKASRKKSPTDCALARAYERFFDGAIISLTRGYIIIGDVAYRYVVPKSVEREIITFDRNKDFKPGEYSLQAPRKYERLHPRKYVLRKERHDIKYPQHKKRHHTTGIRSIY